MDAMTIAGIGMQQDLQRLNSISLNLANVLTPGYKRQVSVSQSFLHHIQGAPSSAIGMAPDGVQHATAIDASAGTLRQTGNALDIAVEGNGFFEVATDNGPAYTRQGALRTDQRGRLITGQGLPLMGVAGELSVSGSSMSIARNGEIRQGERVVGQIKLVQFANPNDLQAIGNGLFIQGSARLADASASGTIRTGYQENSNVNSAQEMVRLMETVRHFESMQRVMQGVDDTMDKTMRKLGEF